MEMQSLQLESRPSTGKRANNALRAKDLVPVVLYGQGQATQHFAANSMEIRKALRTHRKRNVVIKVSGAVDTLAMVKDLDVHPTSDKILHADLLRVSLDKPVEVTVPVRITGEAPGVVQEGGSVDIPLRLIKVRALPDRIPDDIEVSIASLHVGQAILAGDVKLPEGLSLATPASVAVVVVQSTRTTKLADEAAPAAGAAAAAPAAAGAAAPAKAPAAAAGAKAPAAAPAKAAAKK